MFLYGEYSESNEDERELLSKVVSLLCIFSMMSFALFLALIKNEYLCTFSSTETASQFCVKIFEQGLDDSVKFRILRGHRCLYISIEKDVKIWLSDNWEKWDDEKPDW